MRPVVEVPLEKGQAVCCHDNVELKQTCRDNPVEEECSVVPKAGEWQDHKGPRTG